MGEDLKRLQREWRDAQAALDGERRRANDATAARDHLLESTAAKCADRSDQLRAAKWRCISSALLPLLKAV